MAAKKKDTKTYTDGKSAGTPARHGGDGAEVAEDRVQVVEYAAAEAYGGPCLVRAVVTITRPD